MIKMQYVGLWVGCCVGTGAAVGFLEGDNVEFHDGLSVGSTVGLKLGFFVGCFVVGFEVGFVDGFADGFSVSNVGFDVVVVGRLVVGFSVGRSVGIGVVGFNVFVSAAISNKFTLNESYGLCPAIYIFRPASTGKAANPQLCVNGKVDEENPE